MASLIVAFRPCLSSAPRATLHWPPGNLKLRTGATRLASASVSTTQFLVLLVATPFRSESTTAAFSILSSSSIHSSALSRPLARSFNTEYLSTSSVCFPRFFSSSSPRASSPTSSTSSGSSSSADASRTVAPKKHRVVVLGVGWAAYQFLRQVDQRYYEVICISPRNHFLFTPLLASTTVGTLEFRAIVEPVRELKGVHYHQAEAHTIDFKQQKVHCLDTVHQSHQYFDVPYDSLIIAVGTQPNTFNISGVTESNHVFFIKQLSDARKIRECLLERFEEATSDHLSAAERERLSRIVVVGGGPTSVEFSSELYDFLRVDASKAFPGLKSEIIVVEGSDQLLGNFDRKLRDYTMSLFRSRPNIKLMLKSRVQSVEDGKVHLADGQTIECGLVVWGAGVRAVPFIEELKSPFPAVKDLKSQRLITNSHFQVQYREEEDGNESMNVAYSNVFAIGDCAAPEGFLYPQTAQVASQEGNYLADLFNTIANSSLKSANAAMTFQPFHYRYLGMLAYVGGYRSIADLNHKDAKWSGIGAFLLWRGAYFYSSVSWRNRFLMVMLWIKTFLFGRDISRF